MMVTVAVIALLAVSFVPHHHHNGFMCLADEHYSCSDSHGTDVADVLGEADSCTAAAHHWHCDSNSGLCDGKEGHCCGGSGHNDDRSYCIEDEAFLNSRTENYQMHLLPQPVQFFIAIVIAYLADDIAINCTSPEQAKLFAEETKVDALAIAIGNAHGNYKEEPKLRFDILEKVHELVKTPLVLHGGTGIGKEAFIRCHQNGIKKINIATATFDSVERSVRESYEKGEIHGYYDLHQAEIEGAYQNAKRHMEIFYSVGKAEEIDLF